MITHHMGNGLASPCGLEPASVYRGFQGAFNSDWAKVDCPECQAEQPRRVGLGGAGDPTPPDDFLQVYMTHDIVIDAFRRWVTSQGWELRPIPRFGESDDTYVKTHLIVPANLGRLMAERAAMERNQK